MFYAEFKWFNANLHLKMSYLSTLVVFDNKMRNLH